MRDENRGWDQIREDSKWFTQPSHLTSTGQRKSEEVSNEMEEYYRNLDTLDNLREQHSRMLETYESLNDSRFDEVELSKTIKQAAEELEIEELEDKILTNQVWSEGAPKPRLSAAESPFRSQINALRLKSLHLEEKRLLEIRRLQELERLRGPKPKWYELKTPQFHKEARKNNEILAAKKQWGSMREYTEDVWKGRDLTYSSFENADS